jgi:hypothetical protein
MPVPTAENELYTLSAFTIYEASTTVAFFGGASVAYLIS